MKNASVLFCHKVQKSKLNIDKRQDIHLIFNFSFNRSSGSVVLVGCFGMCLRTCSERRRYRGNETRGAECDGKTWRPETKKRFHIKLQGNKVLEPYFLTDDMS